MRIFRKTTFYLAFALISMNAMAQVSINSNGNPPDASAMLDVSSTTGGVLIPRMTAAQRDAIGSPADGLMVFVEDDSCFYFYYGSAWEKVGSKAGPWTASGSDIYNSNAGNVGIGTPSPSEKLDVAGYIQLRGNSGILHYQAPTENYLKFVGNNDVQLGSHNYLRLRIGNVDRGYITASQFQITNDLIADGLVGIGTPSPDASLHIVGTMKFEDGNQAPGKVLVSDTNGVASWADPNEAVSVPDTTQPVPIRYHGSYLFVYPEDNATGVSWDDADAACGNLVAFGFSDWYLPDVNELNAMYKQSYMITGLQENETVKYWSSTQYDLNNAFTMRLDYGGPDPDSKLDTLGHNCRCIRKK